MKKIILLAMLLLPMALIAKDEDKKYLAGAVPEDENGLIVFSQKFAIEGMEKSRIYQTLLTWANNIAESGIQDLRTRQIMASETEGNIVYRIEEWLVFKRLALMLDRTRFRYLLNIECNDGMAKIEIKQISYYYEEDDHGENGKLYKAEEWISDKEALNKKKTKLYKYSAKFRRKTIDRAEALFASARDAFEPEEEPEKIVTKKATKVIQ